jgi:prepilin signal peptidase PulO-like enzyme (type II secretory pathway)
MSAASKANQGSSFLRSPVGIAIGYLLVLFAATAAVVLFPFSIILMGLLLALVGAFLVVAIPVILASYLLLMIAFSRALMGLGRRLLFGADRNSRWQRKPRPLRKDVEPQAIGAGLWDRWIDGS